MTPFFDPGHDLFDPLGMTWGQGFRKSDFRGPRGGKAVAKREEVAIVEKTQAHSARAEVRLELLADWGRAT